MSYYQVLYSELQALDVCKSESRDCVLAERQQLVQKVEITKIHHSQILPRSQDTSNLLLKTKDMETLPSCWWQRKMITTDCYL